MYQVWAIHCSMPLPCLRTTDRLVTAGPDHSRMMAQQGQPQQPDLSVDIASLWGVFLYGFRTSLLMPVFMANVVTDKQVCAVDTRAGAGGAY